MVVCITWAGLIGLGSGGELNIDPSLNRIRIISGANSEEVFIYDPSVV